MNDHIVALVQAGALGLLFFVVYILAFRVLPTAVEAFRSMQAQFTAALDKHESDHKDEVRTIVSAHQQAVADITQEMRTHSRILAAHVSRQSREGAHEGRRG